MEKLTVDIANHQYDVHIGQTRMDFLQLIMRNFCKARIVLQSLPMNMLHHFICHILQEALQFTNHEVVVKTVPAGESCKTSAVYVDCSVIFIE